MLFGMMMVVGEVMAMLSHNFCDISQSILHKLLYEFSCENIIYINCLYSGKNGVLYYHCFVYAVSVCMIILCENQIKVTVQTFCLQTHTHNNQEIYYLRKFSNRYQSNLYLWQNKCSI